MIREAVYRPTLEGSVAAPLRARSTGHYRIEDPCWEEEPRRKTFLELFWCTAGEGTFVAETGTWHLRPGDVFFYFPGDVHRISAQTVPWEYYWMTCDGAHLDEVIAVMEKAEREGRKVVRVHTGDPAIYGAHREQMDRLDELGITYEVIPGVSSAFATAAAINAEYTLPGRSQTVIFTRMEGRTPMPPGEKLQDLARHHASMVIFLSIGFMDEMVKQLEEGGYEPTTPVAVVYKATWPDQKIVIGTLADIAQKVKAEGITKTALTVVGDFLGDEYELSKLYDKHFTTEFRKAKE
mgnify:CR=1 FL=1